MATTHLTSTIECSDPAGLAGIRERGINAAVWRRGISRGVRDSADHLRNYPEFDVRFWGTTDHVLDRLKSRRELASQDFLLDDIASMLRLYVEFSEEPLVGLKLGLVDRRQCPLLHEDCVGLRLLCTYAGVGTLWADNGDVDRRELGFRDDPTPEDANARILKNGAELHQTAEGDVLVLKGCGWPGNQDNGAIHVSPAVDAGGPPRVRLVIDSVEPATVAL